MPELISYNVILSRWHLLKLIRRTELKVISCFLYNPSPVRSNLASVPHLGGDVDRKDLVLMTSQDVVIIATFAVAASALKLTDVIHWVQSILFFTWRSCSGSCSQASHPRNLLFWK